MSTFVQPFGIGDAANWNDPLDPGQTPNTGSDGGVVGNGDGVRQWALGTWWVGNYPSCVTFYEDRLWFAGAPQSPERLDSSNTTAYEIFSPSSLLDGTVADSNSCAFSLNSNTVNAVQWMQSDQNGLIAGTAGGEWVLTSASITEAISPTSVIAKQTTEFGATALAPVHPGETTIFVQAGGRKLRELKYDFVTNGFKGNEISPLAEHATVGGFAWLAIQRTPQQIFWLGRKDGALVSVSYDADQNEVAWAVHQLGGNAPKVLSGAVIPSPDGTVEELWLAVSRIVNGSTVVYVERMSKLWEVGDQVFDATSSPGNPFYRYVPTDTVFADSAQRLVVGSPVTTVSGLTWLENTPVGVMVDGAAHPDVTVDNTGSITLDWAGSDIVVGLRYSSLCQTLPIEAGGADGPAQGKIQRVHRLIFRVYESSGWEVLADSVTGLWTEVPLRETTAVMNQPTPLFTGDEPLPWEGTYERGATVQWRMTQMLPLNVSAFVAQLETQDGG